MMWKPQKIYSNFLLDQPTVLFGEHSIFGLTSFPGAKILVIHGSSLKQNTREQLQKTFSKKALSFALRSWKSEPDWDELKPTVALLESFAPDVILAVGGGAVLDGAKLCRLLYEYPGFEGGGIRLSQLTFKTKLIAIPTTIGSGAEASSAAVLINHVAHRKEMVVSHDLRPDVVVLDPSLVSETPYRQLVTSGLDAVAHVLEGYVSKIDNVLADILAERALNILFTQLSCPELSEINFQRLQYAGYLGGVIQNHCLVGAAHGIAHQISDFGYTHGEAVSLLLPAVIRQNQKDERTRIRYQTLFACCGIGDSANMIAFLEQLNRRSGLAARRDSLKQLLAEQLENCEFVANVGRDPGGSGNPVKVDDGYLKELLGEI